MRRQTGSAMVEFALITPLLLLLLAGVLDYSMALRTAIAVSDAARAGAHYGSLSTANANDTAGMEAAARNAEPSLTDLTVTAGRSCKCPNGSAVNCSGSCGGGALSVYAEVTTQTTARNAFSYPGLSFSGAVSAKAVMRAR
jgi:Flp pilus assembly protein TadG